MMSWRYAGASALVLALMGCKGHPSPVSPSGSSSDAGETPSAELAVPSLEGSAPETATVKIAAIESPTPVCSAPEWPAKDPTKAAEDRQGVIRLGYLRKGDVVEAKAQRVQRSSCAEGWFELLEGGYVCAKLATTDLNAKELADAPHPPYADRPLPYDYGLNLTTGTPLYRRKVTRNERAQYERALAVGKTSSKSEPIGPGAAEGTSGDTPWYAKE